MDIWFSSIHSNSFRKASFYCSSTDKTCRNCLISCSKKKLGYLWLSYDIQVRKDRASLGIPWGQNPSRILGFGYYSNDKSTFLSPPTMSDQTLMNHKITLKQNSSQLDSALPITYEESAVKLPTVLNAMSAGKYPQSQCATKGTTGTSNKNTTKSK